MNLAYRLLLTCVFALICSCNSGSTDANNDEDLSSSSCSSVMESSSSIVSSSSLHLSSSIVVSSSSSIADTGSSAIPGERLVYEGQTYKTVVIGTQTWMAENLNVGTMVDALVGQSNDSLVEKYCYNNSADSCNSLGGLYQWAEAMGLSNIHNITSFGGQISSGNHKGICPAGWHIPKPEEWTTLETYLGPETAATQMKSATGWLVNMGTNSSGFSAIGASSRYNSGSGFPGGLTTITYFWSADQYDQTTGYCIMMSMASPILDEKGMDKASSGFSVRCLKD